MNQILSTQNVNNKKYKNKGSKDIQSIIKFFAIVLAIFGAILVVCSLGKIFTNNEEKIGKGKPEDFTEQGENSQIHVQTESEKEDLINVGIKCDKEIQEIEYYWDKQENKKKINDVGKEDFKIVNIEVPNGENTLRIKVTDVDGNVSEYNKDFSIDKDIEIKMVQVGNNVQVEVRGKEVLKEIEYKLDSQDTVKMQTNEAIYKFELEVQPGEHQIYVKATDVNDKQEEKNKKIKVGLPTKLTIEVDEKEENYIIKAHSDNGLDYIEIQTVEDKKITKIKTDGKDFEYKFPLKENSSNRIRAIAHGIAEHEGQNDSKIVAVRFSK